MKVQTVLARIRECCERILRTNLVGVYVHGSLGFGCFRWEVSDIDYIVVVRNSLSSAEKEALIGDILEIDRIAPPKGLEMSVVLEEYCRHFVYPTPYELHFSNAHRQRCIDNLPEYCHVMHGVDSDLAAHFTIIRHVGFTLCGNPIEGVFGEVPRAGYLDSILLDIGSAASDIHTNPVYVILNLCRVLAFVQYGHVLSKQQGAKWGKANLPPDLHPVITAAEDSYVLGLSFPANIHESLTEFAERLLSAIRKHT